MDVNTIRTEILQKDERSGYIERERAIDNFLLAGGGDLPQAERYVRALEQVLAALSTPVRPDDLIVGRMVEGPLPYALEAVPAGGKSHVGNPFRPTGRSAGHMSLDYASLLRKGLTGIAQEFARSARTPAQQAYSRLIDRAVHAIGAFAARYADAAGLAGNSRAAQALRTTASASGSLPLYTTGLPGLMMPALAAAICASVGPSSLTWS